MPKFFALYIRRSDGKIDIKGRHKLPERNEPTKEQLDRTPDAKGISDFYREVDLTEPKHMDWRRKLGGMLARDLGYSDPERGYILANFPENYRLYEHVKRAEDESKAKTTKNHAGGGNERQDAYLYGHPLGRKKRYRSPADFYPHVLWLATDEEGDPDNCPCKLCCPEELDDKTLAQVNKDTAQAKAPNKANAAPKRTTSATLPQSEQIKAPGIKTEQAQRQAGQDVVLNEDQRLDLSPTGFLCRQGELVWFKKGAAWGLGVLTQRRIQNSVASYTVQPLSHPFGHPPAVNVGVEDLRPWLSWSVPDFTHPGLNAQPVAYETANWQGISGGQFGKGDLEVDASILAAKSIDSSYTPFECLSTQAISNSIIDRSFNGIYLGAERIWRGDILRLRSGNGLDILVVNAITERSANSQPSPPTHNISIHGDIYSLRQHPGPAPDLSTLPSRLSTDLALRNAPTLAKHGFVSSYARATANATISPADVRGRWYAAAQLGPVLLGRAVAEHELAAGNLGEMGARMNARLECQKRGPGSAPVEIRKPDRRAALGAAVPPDFTIVDAQPAGMGESMNLDS